VLALGSPAASAVDCQDGRLDLLLGKPYSEDKARAVSKAADIREMTVGRTVVTADYRSDRLNIVVDLKGNVRRADCG
jgi:peptidase inhibitor I78 family protein